MDEKSRRKRPRKLRTSRDWMELSYFHGMIPTVAKRYIREVGDRLGVTDPRAVGIIVLEHRKLAREAAKP